MGAAEPATDAVRGDGGSAATASTPLAALAAPVPVAVVLGVLGMAATAYVAAGVTALAARSHAWPTGLQHATLDVGAGARSAPRLSTVLGLVALTAVWAVALALARRGVLRVPAAAALSAVWALPLLLAPPTISRDVYAYLAQGSLLQHGLDPYRVSPSALGPGALLDQVDGMWQHVTSPYGPVALLVERAAATVGHGDVARGVLALRLLAVAAVAVAAWAVSRLVAPRHRSVAVLAVAGAPTVLVHLVNGAHLDALVIAGVALALLAEARHRPVLALAVATATTEVKVVGVVVVAALVLRHAFDAPSAARTRVAARDAATFAGTGLVLSLAVPDGLGWVRGLGVAGKGYLPVSLATLPWRTATSAGAHLDVGPWRAAGVLTAAFVVAALLLTSRRRAVAATVGLSLAVLAVLGPAAWPWYLTWCMAPLVVAGSQRVWACVVAIGGVAWLTALPFLTPDQAFRVGLVPELGIVALVAAAVLGAAPRLRGRAEGGG